MAGKPGRSGGHNKISIEEHRLRGTYNPTRHGHRAVLLMQATAAVPVPVPAALLEGLTGRGRVFVEETFTGYAGWTAPSLALLREVGFLLTQVEAQRGQPEERLTQRVLLATIGALRLQD